MDYNGWEMLLAYGAGIVTLALLVHFVSKLEPPQTLKDKLELLVWMNGVTAVVGALEQHCRDWSKADSAADRYDGSWDFAAIALRDARGVIREHPIKWDGKARPDEAGDYSRSRNSAPLRASKRAEKQRQEIIKRRSETNETERTYVSLDGQTLVTNELKYVRIIISDDGQALWICCDDDLSSKGLVSNVVEMQGIKKIRIYDHRLSIGEDFLRLIETITMRVKRIKKRYP